MDEEGPNLTPLLDAILNIMTFFMITSSFVNLDQVNLEVNLPVAQSAVPIEDAAQGWVFLNVNGEGKIVNAQNTADLATSPGTIKKLLQDQKEHIERVARAKGVKTPDIVIVLRVDGQAEYQQVWELLKFCVDIGYKKWQIRVMTG